MIKYIRILFTILFVCLGLSVTIAFAQSAEIPLYPVADMTVSPEKTGGTGGSLYISNNNSETPSSDTYKTYLFYDLNGLDKVSITEGWLEAVCIQGGVGSNEKLQIYGIPDLKDGVDTSSITWENAPCNNTSSSTSLTSDAVYIGDIVMSEKEVTLKATGTAFAELIRKDTNNVLGLVIVRETLRNSRYGLASSQHKTYAPPVLKLKGGIQLIGYADTWHKVYALPEQTQQQKVKKAALIWAIEDTARAFEDGLEEQARVQLNDIVTMLEKDIGADSGKRLFPEMYTNVQNPYLPGLETQASSYIAKTSVYRKSHDWGVEKFPLSKNLRNEFSQRLEIASFLLTQKSGRYAASTELLTNIFDCLEALCYYHTEGDLNAGRTNADANMNRFVYSSYNIAFLQVITMYPDVIPPSVKARWLNCVQAVASYQLKTFGTYSTKNPHGAGFYANMDACYTACMDPAGRLLGNADYIETAKNRSLRMEEYMCADGGWPYLGYANETPTYHQTNIHYLTYYYMISQNAQTLDMLCKSAPYYPVTIEKNSLIEYSSVPYFKQYWERVQPGYIEVIANLANSGENRYLAQNILDQSSNEGSVFGAIFYNPNIEQIEVKSNRVLYDRNIMGLRGHFDAFGYSANGRDWKDDRGKPTLVGAVAIGDGAYPALGFLQNVYGGVYDTADHAYHLIQETKAPRAFDMEERHAETNSYAICPDKGAGAFGSVYHLQKPQAGGGRSKTTIYGGDQSWVLLHDRIIGIVRTTFNEAGDAFGMEGVLQFGEGRGNTAKNITVEDKGNGIYTYGNLKAIIHDHDYSSITTDAPLYNEMSIYGPVGFVKLNDTDLSKSISYPKGHTKYYVAEIGIKDNTPAQVATDFSNGINCMVITTDDKWYMYHNTTSEQKNIRLPEDMYYTSEGKTFFAKKGTDITLNAYGVVLGRKTADIVSLYYDDEKATSLIPRQTLVLKKNFDTDGVAILAVYKSGQLEYLDIDGNNSYKLPEDVSDITIKGFLWKNIKTLKPLAPNTGCSLACE